MTFNNENGYLANLNVVDSDATQPPALSQDDLAAELEFWSNNQFRFDVPPGIGLLDDDFDVTPKETKQHKEATVTVPTGNFQGFDFLPHLSLNQTQILTGMTPFIAYTTTPGGTPTPVVMQPMVIAPASSTGDLPNSTASFPIIYPAHLPAVAAPNNIAMNGGRNSPNTTILPKKSPGSNLPNEQKIAPAPSVIQTPPRKNSISNSAKGHNKSITSQKSAEKKRTVNSSSSKKTSTSTKVTLATSLTTSTGDTDATAAITTTSTSTATASSKPGENQEDKKTVEAQDPVAKLAAEEDKRKRNTAASARFRIKKKMREQALEQTAKEMTVKAETLEGRVKEMELEIKWLRSLIVEKDARLLDTQRPEKRRKTDLNE